MGEFTLYARMSGISRRESERLAAWLLHRGCQITAMRIGPAQEIDYQRVLDLPQTGQADALRVLGSSGGVMAMSGHGDMPDICEALPLPDSGFVHRA